MVCKTAILVTYKEKDIIEESLGLAEAADYKVVEIITVKRLGLGKYGIGKGKAGEVKRRAEELGVDCIIVDEKLKVTQCYNLLRFIGKDVIDREKLILEIFGKRAFTPEAKLQVKLAELIYELPRVKEMVRRVRMGEQPGMHGYGRYEAEKYVRSINRQIHNLMEKLKKVSTRRELQRKKRRELNAPFISLAGYTGAGKTTLFNLLTDEDGKVTGKPFTTLSTTVRKYTYRDLEFFISDTVGFIDRLPHYLIEAFKSTLEELKFADMVLLLVDCSVHEKEFKRRLKASMDVLAELAVDPSKTIVVLNKIDLVGKEEVERKCRLIPEDVERIAISAKTGEGVEDLKKMIYEKVTKAKKLELTVEEEKAKKLIKVAEWMKPMVKIVERRVGEGLVSLEFTGPEWAIRDIERIS